MAAMVAEMDPPWSELEQAWTEIRRGSLHDPWLHALCVSVELGTDRELALVKVVLSLVEARRVLHEKILEATVQLSRPVSLKVPIAIRDSITKTGEP